MKEIPSNTKFKKIAVAALLLWSTHFAKGEIKAQEIPPSTETPKVLEGYGFSDVFEQSGLELSQEDIEESIIEASRELYSSMGDQPLTAEDIPDELKALIFQAQIQRISGHGETVTATSEQVFRYFGLINEETILRDSVYRFDATTLFNENSMRIEKFEEEGKRGIRILFDIDINGLSGFFDNNQTRILNASLEFGTMQIVIYFENAVDPMEEYTAIYDNNDNLFGYVPNNPNSLETTGYYVDSTGNVRNLTGEDPAVVYTPDELAEIIRSQDLEWIGINGEYITVEPYHTRRDESGGIIGAHDLGNENREQVYEFARNHPDTIFVVAAGNINSNSRIDLDQKPNNAIFVGMYYDPLNAIPGQADINIPYIAVNDTGLKRDTGESSPIDSSSEATAVISALLQIYSQRHPELNRDILVRTFIEEFSEDYEGTYLLYQLADRSRVVEQDAIRILDVGKIISSFSSN